MHLGQSVPIVIASEVYILNSRNLLVFRRRSDNQWFPNKFVAPGGRVDLREDVLSTALREVREETNVRIPRSSTKLKAVIVHHDLGRKEDFLVFIFLARLQRSLKIHQINKEGTAQWVPIEDIKKTIDQFPLIRYYLPNILKNSNKILFTNIDWRNGELIKIHSWIES